MFDFKQLGRTALHYAMTTNKAEEMEKLLVEHGANRSIRDVVRITLTFDYSQ